MPSLRRAVWTLVLIGVKLTFLHPGSLPASLRTACREGQRSAKSLVLGKRLHLLKFLSVKRCSRFSGVRRMFQAKFR